MSYLPNLTTLAALRAELRNITPVGDDTYLQTLIQMNSDDLATQCNRVFYYQKQVTEKVSGFATTRLRPSFAPLDLTQPVSVTFDSAVLDPSIWFVENVDPIFIFNKTGWYWTATRLPNVQQDPFPGHENPLYAVQYSGGYVTPQQAVDNPLDPILSVRTLPFDLEQACILLCVLMYRRRGTDYTIDSERLMSYSVKYRDKMSIPFVERVIARYRRIGMSR